MATDIREVNKTIDGIIGQMDHLIDEMKKLDEDAAKDIAARRNFLEERRRKYDRS